MKKRYNWAILGCGHIAKKMSADLKLLPNACRYATASRSLDKSKAFAHEYGFQKAYGSYEEMLADEQVDIVYIATPHSFHKAHTLLALAAKKAVLCEKAFAINRFEAKEMFEASRRHNAFLMEAFWTRLNPTFQRIDQLVQQETLGKLLTVKADFMFNGEFNPEKRLYNVDLGGGSLLDIGIYPVFFALHFFGLPKEIKTSAHFSSTGAEERINMLLEYEGGQSAVLTSSFGAYSFNDTELCFEQGSLRFGRGVNPRVQIKTPNESKEFQLAHQGLGYQFEAAHLMDCLDKGLIHSPIVTPEFTLELMQLLDQIRLDANIVFPNHD